MIENKKDLKEWLDYEKRLYGMENSFIHQIKLTIGSEKAVIWKFQRRLRITEYHKNTKHKLRYHISKVKWSRMKNKYGLHIGLNICDKGLKIMHLGPILNNRAKLGKDCTLHVNTAFVANGLAGEVPTVGDNCVIGVGATLIGGIKIADGIAVGANALVNKSFEEDNIAIAGVPAKKVSNNGKNKWGKQ